MWRAGLLRSIRFRVSLWTLAILYDIVFIDPLVIKTKLSSIPGMVVLIAIAIASIALKGSRELILIPAIVSYFYMLFTSKREPPISIDISKTKSVIAKNVEYNTINILIIPIDRFEFVKSLIELLIVESDKAISRPEEAATLLSAAYALWLEAARKRRLLLGREWRLTVS